MKTKIACKRAGRSLNRSLEAKEDENGLQEGRSFCLLNGRCGKEEEGGGGVLAMFHLRMWQSSI